jgi:hypothetical protein
MKLTSPEETWGAFRVGNQRRCSYLSREMKKLSGSLQFDVKKSRAEFQNETGAAKDNAPGFKTELKRPAG